MNDEHAPTSTLTSVHCHRSSNFIRPSIHGVPLEIRDRPAVSGDVSIGSPSPDNLVVEVIVRTRRGSIDGVVAAHRARSPPLLKGLLESRQVRLEQIVLGDVIVIVTWRKRGVGVSTARAPRVQDLEVLLFHVDS